MLDSADVELYLTVMAEIETLQISYAGEPRVLKMTHGLKRRLLGLITTPETAVAMLFDATMADTVVIEVLRPRTPVGEPETILTPEQFQEWTEDGTLESDDYDKILLWVQKVLLDFFMGRMQTTLEMEERLTAANPKITALASQVGLSGLPKVTSTS